MSNSTNGNQSVDLMKATLQHNSPAYLLRNVMLEEGVDMSVWEELPDVSYVQAIVHSDWFQSVGLDIPVDASDADIAVAMRASRTMHQSDAWVRGDLINWIRANRYGGGDIPREEMIRFADTLGVASFKRLLNNATTCAVWPLDHRHPSHELSYSHHEALNAIADINERQAWAERCIAEGMSIRALREALDNDAVSIPAVPTTGQDGEQAVAVFASETFSRAQAIKVLALEMSKALASNASVDAAVVLRVVIEQFVEQKLIKLPPSQWAKAGLGMVKSGENGAEDGDNE